MADNYVVYRCDQGRRASRCREGLIEWTPSLTKIIPDQLIADRSGFVKNWLFHAGDLFAGGDAYKIVLLEHESSIVAQCLVTGPSMRFPFIEANQVQIGLVHTAPAHRGKGHASRLVEGVLASYPGGTTFWWVTTQDNMASQRLAEGAGFKAFGKAKRVSRLGIPHFHLNSQP